jgi:hypothetical protein
MVAVKSRPFRQQLGVRRRFFLMRQ